MSLADWPPLTDDEVRALGYEPTDDGWKPIRGAGDSGGIPAPRSIRPPRPKREKRPERG